MEVGDCEHRGLDIKRTEFVMAAGAVRRELILKPIDLKERDR